MATDTLLRVAPRSSAALPQDFSGAIEAMRRRFPRIVVQGAREGAGHEGVGDINQPAQLRSRLGGREFALPIRFHKRFLLGSSSELSGSDESGLVSVRLSADAPGDTVRFGLSAAVTDQALPSEILPFAQLIQCAQNGESIDLWFAGRRMAGSVVTLPDDDVEEFAAYVDLVERIDRFQRMTGTSFAMPSQLSGEELEELDAAERLMSGDVVRWNWGKANITMTADPRDRLESESETAEMAVEVGGDYFVEIARHSILLGQISQRFIAGSMTVTPSADVAGEFDVELRPGKDRTATARLTSRAHFDPFDRSDTERVAVSAEDLNTFDENAASLASQIRG